MSPEHLARTLSAAKHYAPQNIEWTRVDAMIAAIERNQVELSTEDSESIRLQNLVISCRQFLDPVRAEKLAGTPTFVLPYEPCLAFSQRTDDTNVGQIIISTGMVDLLHTSIQDAWLQKLIPDELTTMPVGRLNQPLSVVLNAVTALLRYRFYRFGESLPKYDDVLTSESKDNVAISLAGVLTFLLLHELGHLELGHFERNTSHLSPYDMAYQQNLTDFQLQETEADQYALESLSEAAKELAPYWMSQGLAYFVQFELLSGHEDDSHPLTINRNYHAERFRKATGIQTPGVSRLLGQRFAEIVRDGPPGSGRPLIETPRSDCLIALREVIRVLLERGVDLRPFADGLD